MKTLPIPQTALDSLKRSYDHLMMDDLPIDFDKVSALIQAAGRIVRVVECDTFKPVKMRRVLVNGKRYAKAV